MNTSKIIIGTVGGGKYTVTAPIMQEHYGIILKIEGAELPEIYQVDFSNDEHHGTSVTMIGNADGVLIPRQFIDTGKDVFAFLYWVGEDYGKTVYKFRIPNQYRPDRTNEQPTPEQQSVIDQAIAALNDAVEQTAQDVIDADASAQSASESAEQAQESARTAGLYSDTAQTYANSAEISADSASASATASANSASQSAQIKDDVEDMVDDAQASASASAQSASASANSASQASASATSAIQASSNASDMALSAQTYSEIAQNHATHAGQSAQTASIKATESAQSASQALTYKTDAESAKTSAQTAQGLAESARDDAVQAKTDAESARDEAQSIVGGISGKVEQIDSNTERIESLEDDRYKPYAVDTASGAVASFSDGADDIPLKSLIVNIDPVQDTSSGDPSPENICPISGWTQVDVEQSGVNLYSFDENKITTGNTTASTIRAYYPLGIKGCTLSFSAYQIDSSQVAGMYINIGKLNNGTLEIINSLITPNGVLNRTFTFSDDEEAVLMSPSTSPLNLKNNLLKYRIQVEKNDSVSEYSPYTGRSVTINLGQTVYGGKLDVLSGKLTVTHKVIEFDGSSDERWDRYTIAEGNILYRTWIDDKKQESVSQRTVEYDAYMCNSYMMAENGVTKRYAGTFSSGLITTMDFVNNSYADVDEWRMALASNPIQFYYPMETPIEIQLSANQINSLYGVNNIWADSGDTEAEYRADTKLYIERLTAPDSADMIADANITSGQYFMVGNSLYKATANIANGAQIIVGTNAVRKSLSEALNEINA